MKYQTQVMIVTLLAIFALGGNLTKAQPPGYLGMRNSLDYTFHFTPALNSNFWNGNNGSNAEGITLSKNHQISLERVIGRRSSIGFHGDYYQTGIGNVNRVKYPEWNTDPIKGWLRIRGAKAGIHFTLFPFFRRGSLAPLGFFNRFDFNVRRTVAVHFADSPVYADSLLGKYNSFSMAVATGYRGLLFGSNRLFYEIGVRFGFSIIPLNWTNDKFFAQRHSREFDQGRIFVGCGFLF